jgi:hypothetical protein
VSYESTAEPIKLGYLMDFRLPEDYPQALRDDLTQSLELVFDEGLKRKIIDRPVEIVYREVEGLPKGTVKAVIDGYGELVDEGCLAVFGPSISDNAVPTREAIEERFRVPTISVCGSDDWLGEWTFAFPQGSLTDEPIFWADLLAKGGHTDVGVLIEQSLVGESYLKSFRSACRHAGIRIVAEEPIAQTAQDVGESLRKVQEAGPTALVHCGFGFGIVHVNSVLDALGWDPPRFTSTAFQNAWMNPVMWKALLGWTGIDQYDEGTRLRRRPSPEPARGEGGPRACEDGSRGVRCPGYPSLLRKVDTPGLDGRRLPRGSKARSRRRQLASRGSLWRSLKQRRKVDRRAAVEGRTAKGAGLLVESPTAR